MPTEKLTSLTSLIARWREEAVTLLSQCGPLPDSDAANERYSCLIECAERLEATIASNEILDPFDTPFTLDYTESVNVCDYEACN